MQLDFRGRPGQRRKIGRDDLSGSGSEHAKESGGKGPRAEFLIPETYQGKFELIMLSILIELAIYPDWSNADSK